MDCVSPVGTVTESIGVVLSYVICGTTCAHGVNLSVALSTKKSKTEPLDGTLTRVHFCFHHVE